MGQACSSIPGQTLLLNAVLAKDEAKLAKVVGQGVDINSVLTPNGRTALMLTAQTGDSSLLDLCLALGAGASVEYKDAAGDTALTLAIQGDQVPIAKLLLKKGCKADMRRGTDGCTPLHLAARMGQAELCKTLIDAKAYVNATDHQGSTPLHLACQSGNLETCKVLCEAKADPTRINSQAKSPGDYAKDSKEIQALLFEWGDEM